METEKTELIQNQLGSAIVPCVCVWMRVFGSVGRTGVARRNCAFSIVSWFKDNITFAIVD